MKEERIRRGRRHDEEQCPTRSEVRQPESDDSRAGAARSGLTGERGACPHGSRADCQAAQDDCGGRRQATIYRAGTSRTIRPGWLSATYR